MASSDRRGLASLPVVPLDVLEVLLREVRLAESVEQIANYDHAPSFARLIDMPYMNIHLALDEVGRQMMAQSFSYRIFKKKKKNN